jgi:hypothetical protein
VAGVLPGAAGAFGAIAHPQSHKSARAVHPVEPPVIATVGPAAREFRPEGRFTAVRDLRVFDRHGILFYVRVPLRPRGFRARRRASGKTFAERAANSDERTPPGQAHRLPAASEGDAPQDRAPRGMAC